MNKLRNLFADYTSIKVDKKQILNKIINDTENKYFSKQNEASLTCVQMFGCHFIDIMFHKVTIYSRYSYVKGIFKIFN